MPARLSGIQFREVALILAPVLAVILLALWGAAQFVEPAPPKSVSIATGGEGGGYYGFGKRYAQIFKRAGITLQVVSTKGSLDNIERLKDPKSAIHVALLQGGIANSKTAPGIVSLGRVFLEPLWVFYRGGETVDRLAAFAAKRIAIGPEGSGTRALALELLKANGITAETTTLLPVSGKEAVDGLAAGRIDAIFLAFAPESPVIQALLRDPGVKLLSFVQAEAYTRRFPYLSRIVLPKGVVDLVANIPDRDVELIAPAAALVAREDLHPAIVGLLTEAAKEVHAPGGLFHRIGEFPRAADPEFELSEDAERIYKNGPPFLQRYLPFWLAIFIERMKILLLPVLTLVLPLFKLVPWLYRWRVRRRINYWYGRLKALEADFAWDNARSQYAEHLAEAHRIDMAVSSIPVPLNYADQYYSLRAAVDLVLQRIEQRSAPARSSPAAVPAT